MQTAQVPVPVQMGIPVAAASPNSQLTGMNAYFIKF